MTRIHVAPVLTMDPNRPRAEAMAVAGDRVVAVGTAAEVRAAVPAGTPEETHDGVILPGLIDAHLHMQRGGLKALTYLPDGAGLDEFIETMDRTFHDEGWPRAQPPTLDERVEAVGVAQSLFHQLGVTGIVDPATTVDEMRGYQETHRRGELTMRTVAMPYLELGSTATPDVDAVIAHLEGTGVSTGFGDDELRIGPIKVYADGEALKGQALLERPWDESGYLGLQRISDEDFARLVRFCAEHGWGVGTHAVGGAAIALVAREYAAAGDAVAQRRFQIIHGYLEPAPETIAIAARAGAIASLQPSIIWHNGAGLRAALGERAEHANPVRSWLDAGAVVAFGSDGPFFAFDPRHLMWQAVTRRVRGEDRPLSLDEAITVEEALAAYTTGAAYAAFAESTRGLLRAGRLADWALWSDDPTTVATDELRALRVLRTDVGGRTVHDVTAR
ncbi:amidohydrolase [Jiangella endophytica]|uniref:amidohydrolase n=1 Tax=Jiangella endophytica TaxID=1623398 RepID=UPI000E350107|nr:amidohydrolase family protein [Jiangella endophytica]